VSPAAFEREDGGLIQDISPGEFCNRCNSGELWQLLDVRESWETKIAAVDSAIFIPMTEITGRLGELDREQPVAVMCHAGVRSARVAAFLQAQGFRTVVNIQGGIDAWSLEVDSSIPRY